MEAIQMNKDVSNSIDVAKTAFERVPGIKTYHQQGNTVIGKTGAGLGSYGESVIVQCQPNTGGESSSLMTVSGEREVSTNITANPDKYVQQFVSCVYDIKDKPIDEILAIAEQAMSQGGTKEVTDANQQASGNWLLIVAVIFVFLMFIFTMGSI